MSEPTPTTPARRNALHVIGIAAFAGLVLGLAALGTCGGSGNAAADPPDPADKNKEPTVGGLPLFHGWPKDQKPDVAVVLTGQTFGLLQPCGCSRPQQGGLERRAVFINSLKAKGWTVAGLDLGDLYPQKGGVEDQAKLKYKLTMNALRDMSYVAVGVGKNEFAAGIDTVLGEYALQKEQPPFLLAGNLMGVVGGKPQPREDRFPKPPGATRPMVGLAEVAVVNNFPVGIVGTVGASLGAEVKKLDPGLTFEDNQEVLKRALASLGASPHKPVLNVLLFQGTPDEARKVAEDWPQFRVILCQSDDPEPPQFPEYVAGSKHPTGQKTMLIQIGHKGRYLGVLGVFKTKGGFDLKYQLVPLGEEYITPGTEEAARKANHVLPMFDTYSEQVRDRKFLQKVTKTPHPAQLQQPKLNLSFVGSDKCKGCHAAHFTKWEESKHSHALEALEKIAKRPNLRQFDGECVQCHVVGLLHDTGYQDEKASPHLKHVGCESCHGPGSGHATNAKDAALLALQSPWKQKPDDRLPDIELIKKIGALPPVDRGKIPLKPQEQLVINRVSSMCSKCHDAENDPHFDLFTYWPKVNHTFPKK